MSTDSSQKPRTTLEQKLMIIDYFHASKQPQQATVDYFKDKYSVSTSSLSEWIKYEAELRTRFEESKRNQSYHGYHLRNARRKVSFKYNEINRAMGEFVEARFANGQIITETLLREHWKICARKYGVEDPKRLEGFSHGWLSQFKKRHGINKKTMKEHNLTCKIINDTGSENQDVENNDPSGTPGFGNSSNNSIDKRVNLSNSLHLNSPQDFTLPASLSSYANSTSQQGNKQISLPLGSQGQQQQPLQPQSRNLLLQPQLGSAQARLNNPHTSPDSLLSPTNPDNDYPINLDGDRYTGYEITPSTPLSIQPPMNHRVNNGSSNPLAHNRHNQHHNSNLQQQQQQQQQQKYPNSLNNYHSGNTTSSRMQGQPRNSYGGVNKSNLNPGNGNSPGRNSNANAGSANSPNGNSNNNNNTSGQNHFQSFLMIDNQLQMSMNRLANNIQRDDANMHDIQSNDSQQRSPPSRQNSLIQQESAQTQRSASSSSQSQSGTQTSRQKTQGQGSSGSKSNKDSNNNNNSNNSSSAVTESSNNNNITNNSSNSSSSNNNNQTESYLPDVNININDMERFIFVWAEKFFTSNEYGPSFVKSREVFQEFRSKFLEEKAKYILQRGSSSVVDDFFLRRKK